MSNSDETLKDEIDVGIHRISSQVGADGSAEVMFAAPMTRTMSTPLGSSVPMSRTKSTPLGGVSYAMRRVLSRDDRGRHATAAAASKQEAVGLMSPHTSASPLFKTESGLSPENISYSVRKVFSKKEGEWQSALHNREVEGLMSQQELVYRVSSRVDSNDEGAETILDSDQFDDNSLHGSGYGLRQVKSTPLRGMEDGYSLKRTKTSGHDGSSMHNPLSLVRSRYSSIGKKGSKGKGNDDASTIAESDSSSTVSDYGQIMKKQRKFFSNKMIIASMMLFSLGVAAGGGMYLMKPDMFRGAGGDSDPSEMIVVANIEAIDVSSSVPSSQPSNSLTTLTPIMQSSATPQPTQGVTTAKPIVEETINALPLPTQAPSRAVTSSPTQNLTTVEPTTDTQNVTTVKPANDTQIAPTTPPTESIVTLPPTAQNSTSSPTTQSIMTPPPTAQNSTSSPTTLPPNATVAEELVEEEEAEGTITTFYVMADAPYSDDERYNLMPNHIEQLDDDGEFLVHLGDLQYAVVDQCREGAYYEAKEILKKSRMPTFVLPGDNDINDCYSMSHAEEMWMKYFSLFDQRWDHSLDVTRWGDLDESFSFIHKGVLYFGLNMVGGTPYSNSEKSRRHREHLERVSTIMNDHLDDFKVLVLLGHAEPSSYHRDFFEGDSGFISMIKEMGKPTMHFHGDWHEYYEKEGEYGVDNYMRISLDGESVAPPIRVTIDVSKPNPVKVSRRWRSLDVDCCSEGWPRLGDDDDGYYYYSED
jgi:hypothetical protein